MDRIGVALSGGGHRATVWGLGVLLRLVDCGANRQVVSVSSVSGGSIANGIVAQRLDYPAADPAAFEAAVRPALGHIATEGLLFFGRPTNRYVAVALGAAGVAGLTLLALVGAVLVAAFGGPRRTAVSAALLAAFVVSFAGAVLLFARRGEVTDRALARVHFPGGDGPPTRLRDVDRSCHHVFCATELQAADHCYFTPRAVYNYRLGVGGPGGLALSTAVQCSACLPGGFPPRALATAPFGFVRLPSVKEPAAPPSRMVLSDGGVYDNMADQWEHGFADRVHRWPELAALQPAADVLVVVNASAGWTWKAMGRLWPLVSEVVGLLRPTKVMYDVTTSRRRYELVERFLAAELLQTGLRGSLVHIAQSPYNVPDRMVGDADPARATRAAEALAFLGGSDEDRRAWRARARASGEVGTVLGALGEQTTVALLEHAYVLTMVNLYVVLGIGSLEPVDRSRLAALCRG